jgi:glutaredoxin-related protein
VEHPPRTEPAAAFLTAYHPETVDAVKQAVAAHPVVVVGMGWNPFVKRARRDLDRAGVAYHYLGFGNYLSMWRPRLAVKLWTGWPTFPQVFVRGTFIGGADETRAALADGSLRALLDA